MIYDIIGTLIWGALFFAAFPVWLIGASAAVHKHHAGGRRGYVRDVYLTQAPLMPGGVALYFALGRTFNALGDVGVWAVTVVIAAAGAALFWAPPVRAARDRMKAAGQTAQAVWAETLARPDKPPAGG